MIDITKVPEVTISYSHPVPISERIKIMSSEQAAELLHALWGKLCPGTIDHVESFVILLLNHSNYVLGAKCVARGGISSTIVDVRVVAQHALKANATGVILCHNHPSGNANPSELDMKLTKEIVSGLAVLSIRAMDHIIITSDPKIFHSLADDGMMPDA